MAGKLTKEQVKQLTHNIPKTRYSWTLETYYARRLRQLISNWKQIASDHINRMINPLVTGGSLMLADDDHADDIAAAIAIMLVAINGSESDIYLASLATSFVNSVNTFSYHNVQAQANHVGLKAIESNSTIDDYTKMKIKENVALIKSMKQEFVDRIEKTIYEGINSGGGIGQIAKFLTKTTQMANNRAALIANDQTGSILGQLDTYRQQKAGAYGYIWQSMEDARVRPTHQALDQTFQKYNDPDGGDDGQMPGEPIRCRCVALPTFDM